ncbi:MAG: cell division protein FtsA [Bacteroidales bacterium]
MDTSEIVVGLDVGTTKIAAIVGRRNELNKIEILGSGKTESIGVNRGMVSNIEKTVQSITKAVKEAEEVSDVNIKYVNVGIAGQHIKSIQQRGNIMRNSYDDEISHEDIEKLIENMHKLVMQPGEEIIDVIPQEFIVDDEAGIKDPVGMAGVKLEANFHIITGQIAAAKNINRCVNKAGMDVDGLILEPLASSDAVLSEEEKEAGVVLVDIGGGTTDIAIFQEGIIRHSAVIPLGGSIVTEDIKEGCSIISSQAEALKVKFGSALANKNKEEEVISIPGLRGRPPKEITLKNLASIVQARMEEILEYIYYEVKNSGYEKKMIAGMVLTGGGAQLNHIAQLAEFKTGLDTRIGYPNEHLASSVPEEITSPQFATGVGLVIQGLKRLDKKKARGNEEKDSSKKKKSGFFDTIVRKGKNFFDDDGVR